jgi:hypothetical protein
VYICTRVDVGQIEVGFICHFGADYRTRSRATVNVVDLMIFPELLAATHVCPEFIKAKKGNLCSQHFSADLFLTGTKVPGTHDLPMFFRKPNL